MRENQARDDGAENSGRNFACWDIRQATAPLRTGTSTLSGAVNVTWSKAACAGSPENSTARRWPVPASKRSTTGLNPFQPCWATSSASSADRSGVRSAGPASLLIHGPGDHRTEGRVRGRLLMSLAVLENVGELGSSHPPCTTVVGSASSALAVNWTVALTMVASLGIPTLRPTMLGPMCRSLPPMRTLVPSCSASSEFATIVTVFVTGAASQRHPQV